MQLRILIAASGYALALFIFQCQWISRLVYPGLRVDMLLPLVLAVALVIPFHVSLVWALGCGMLVDTFAGRLWGLHPGSYVLVVLFVHIGAYRVNLNNVFYKMGCVALCAAFQSLAIALYIVPTGEGRMLIPSFWIPFIVRTLATAVLTPLITLPFARYIEWLKASV